MCVCSQCCLASRFASSRWLCNRFLKASSSSVRLRRRHAVKRWFFALKSSSKRFARFSGLSKCFAQSRTARSLRCVSSSSILLRLSSAMHAFKAASCSAMVRRRSASRSEWRRRRFVVSLMPSSATKSTISSGRGRFRLCAAAFDKGDRRSGLSE